MAKNSKVIAVVISDDHVSLKNIEPSIKCLDQAVDLANKHKVHLISAGDLHDTKALHRSECIRKIRYSLKRCFLRPYLLVGNHDLENEKGRENSLSSFEDLADIIDHPKTLYLAPGHQWYAVPYFSDKTLLINALGAIPNRANVIMHQGVLGAKMGEYVMDRSSIDPACLDRFSIVYSGHYHQHQTVGKLTYFGSPYTTSFSEANDGEKGVWLLLDSGEIQLVPSQVRKHVIIESHVSKLSDIQKLPSDSLLWLKVTGPASKLSLINKNILGEKILGHSNFKLDKIQEDKLQTSVKNVKKKNSFAEVMQDLVKESKLEPDDLKTTKKLLKEILDENSVSHTK